MKNNEIIKNITMLLHEASKSYPNKVAISAPYKSTFLRKEKWRSITFKEWEQYSSNCTKWLTTKGINKGTKVFMLVKPSIEFSVLIFGIMKLGAIPILLDAGMGTKNIANCINKVQPEIFIGIPKAHLLRLLHPKSLKSIKSFLFPLSLKAIILEGNKEGNKQTNISHYQPIKEKELAAIFFTSGSTGAPKGVEYSHSQMHAQAKLMKDTYNITANEVDLSVFPLFILFCPAWGITSIIPDIDFTKPGETNPKYIASLIQQFKVTHSFGSPALWKNVSNFCHKTNTMLPSIKRILIAGAPVPLKLLQEFSFQIPNGEIHTPYGATEALPITTISAATVIRKQKLTTQTRNGVCVGLPISEMKIIKITDKPIQILTDDLFLEQGIIGELIVRGPVISRKYFKSPHFDQLAKVKDTKGQLWHRMEDTGYFDREGYLWFCGRKSHRVVTKQDTFYSVPTESLFNQIANISRCALVPITLNNENQLALCVELVQNKKNQAQQSLTQSLIMAHAQQEKVPLKKVFFYPKKFPVDKRHNAKIERNLLSIWAEDQLRIKPNI